MLLISYQFITSRARGIPSAVGTGMLRRTRLITAHGPPRTAATTGGLGTPKVVTIMGILRPYRYSRLQKVCTYRRRMMLCWVYVFLWFLKLEEGHVPASWLLPQLPMARLEVKGLQRGPQNREPQENDNNIIGLYLPGSLCSHYIPTIFLGFPIWGPWLTPLNRVIQPLYRDPEARWRLTVCSVPAPSAALRSEGPPAHGTGLTESTI